MTDRVTVRRALLSVSDKAGIVEFARFLAAQGAEIPVSYTHLRAHET